MRNGQIPATESQKAQKLVPSEDRMWGRAQSRRVIPQSGSSPHFITELSLLYPNSILERTLFSRETDPKKRWLRDVGTSMGGDEAIY